MRRIELSLLPGGYATPAPWWGMLPRHPGGYASPAPWGVCQPCTMVGMPALHHGGYVSPAPMWVCQPCSHGEREVPGHHGGRGTRASWWESTPGIPQGVLWWVYSLPYYASHYASLGTPLLFPLIHSEQAGYTPRVVGLRRGPGLRSGNNMG